MIVLDTHALIWWVNKDDTRLSSVAADAIDQALAGDGVVASSISAWELAMLVSKGKLDLSIDVLTWLSVASEIDGFSFVPVDNVIAVKSQTLPGDFHPDPADRIIVALARELGAELVTADRKIIGYPHVATIW
ncbi:type II toxin-antitoxin system VapC family toxin [Pseudaminobacter soli (ex Li et al. 2025)]|uniref:VapC toxin family PIN domain ribonuclease n=1 Tax=Pseudaminobacter soli (ex Li et al. 2025) TaxID=1295366 RepID=A0A2P7SA93_9HYPH|nr:type II toxin-antitoxin system VapC family toxin [Mesorhizobium soli]PSJ59406.1 VapC toxin family PIN domain ribonuclease [Mesorhizobium soli]